MTTEKQIEANKQNALVSTGPATAEGKAIVAQNAVKHGIFARDLIITSGDGKEDEQEYRELLEGLITSLNPSGQMECVLVEKIAVDFWRLRRVLRFESGSIRKFLDMAINIVKVIVVDLFFFNDIFKYFHADAVAIFAADEQELIVDIDGIILLLGIKWKYLFDLLSFFDFLAMFANRFTAKLLDTLGEHLRVPHLVDGN